MKVEEAVVIIVADATIPEIKDFIKHSPVDSQEIKPKSSRKESPIKASVEKKAQSVRKESPNKEEEKRSTRKDAKTQ
jgi:hypothetical protein